VLLAYLAERKGRRGALLRTLEKGVRLGGADVCEVVSDAARRAGLPAGVTPKTLRQHAGSRIMPSWIG